MHFIMILYPTETLYALGVNALKESELDLLRELKERDKSKAAMSWLVRTIDDIAKYAEMTDKAAKIAEHFLPGSLTLVLKADVVIPQRYLAPDGTIGFRISTDPQARKVIEDFMAEHNAPLTCTSANVSGAPTLPTPGEILQQFGPRAHMIDTVIDDGPRKGLASTIVRIIGDEISILREGEISEKDIYNALE